MRHVVAAVIATLVVADNFLGKRQEEAQQAATKCHMPKQFILEYGLI